LGPSFYAVDVLDDLAGRGDSLGRIIRCGSAGSADVNDGGEGVDQPATDKKNAPPLDVHLSLEMVCDAGDGQVERVSEEKEGR